MPLLWVGLWLALPPLALPCGPDCCSVHDRGGSKETGGSTETKHCSCGSRQKPTGENNNNNNNNNNKHASERRTARCRYETRAFSIGIEHAAFFLEDRAPTPGCPAPRRLLDLSLHLRASPPVNLSTHGAGDGGRLLTWSSPYPSSSSSSSSSSSLNKHITYQLSYRTDRQDNWTTEEVTNTSVTLEERLLLPGHRYQARVRARVSGGQWSDWAPPVAWRTKEGESEEALRT
ncbi:Interleukin-3 receptor class 2 subunit beta [Liparis tanakae]|uniref:Interleukin-3 receptor class 2 subunit beta n=1 Tax=Liparis tanakae TaxID=230148 RepID=A0A4Z2FZY9_9TELE|nr:Interleukin-3 receptor class 2 subunit beta [Liparis tanakae]